MVVSNDSSTPKFYEFQMPGEERIFLDHFFKFAGALALAFFFLGIMAAKMSAAESMIRALILVGPFVILYYFFANRFADTVSLDFETRKIRFSFEGRGKIIEKSFDEIQKVKFQYYLTFISEDMRIMIKRPRNRKEIFLMLEPFFTIDRGLFGSF